MGIVYVYCDIISLLWTNNFKQRDGTLFGNLSSGVFVRAPSRYPDIHKFKFY